jgi:hypothetical protein
LFITLIRLLQKNGKIIKQGIDDWQIAFENAGWKNAIRGEYWPENDPTMSLEDARFSVLRYFAADIQNAYGPNVHDPRTGEILESHWMVSQHYEPFKKLVLNSNCCSRPSRKN